MTDKCALVCDSLFPLCNLPFLITAAWASIWGMLMIVTFLFMSQLLYSLGDVTEQTIFRHSNEVVDRWNEKLFQSGQKITSLTFKLGGMRLNILHKFPLFHFALIYVWSGKRASMTWWICAIFHKFMNFKVGMWNNFSALSLLWANEKCFRTSYL